ncbi:hypothetical protein SARC_12218, partial [Sphaeroforma arctica JP610]
LIPSPVGWASHSPSNTAMSQHTLSDRDRRYRNSAQPSKGSSTSSNNIAPAHRGGGSSINSSQCNARAGGHGNHREAGGECSDGRMISNFRIHTGLLLRLQILSILMKHAVKK